MSEVKNPLASKTIWGGFIMALPVLCSLVGYNLTAEKIAILNLGYDSISTFVGLMLVAYGRWTAEERLGF